MPHETVVNQNDLLIYTLNLGLFYLSNDIKIINFGLKLTKNVGSFLKIVLMVDKSNKSDSGNFATIYCTFALPLEDNKFY